MKPYLLFIVYSKTGIRLIRIFLKILMSVKLNV